MRRLKQQLQRIDIDELFDSPVNRGMLSFLERPPEEAQQRLREKQRVDESDSNRLIHPIGKLPIGEQQQTEDFIPFPSPNHFSVGNRLTLQDDQRVSITGAEVKHPQGELPAPDQWSILDNHDETSANKRETVTHPVGNSLPDVNYLLSKSPLDVNYPVVKLDPGVTHPVGNSLPRTEAAGDAGDVMPLLSKSPPGVTHPEGDRPAALFHGRQDMAARAKPTALLRVTHPQGQSAARSLPQLNEPLGHQNSSIIVKKQPPPGVIHPQGVLHANQSINTPVKSRSLPEIIDGAVVGRRQKVRRAIVAQDGHSSGEQLLYQCLWNAATIETADSRLLSIGYNGMSSLCKLDRSNCKKNIQSLAEKLAVQVTETYQSASSTGTTYRIFSYKEILRRREAAGLTWVIRTSGVRFVNPSPPGGDLTSPPIGNLPIEPVGNLPAAPKGELPTDRIGKTPTHPVCETPTPLGIDRNLQENTSSLEPIYEALAQYGSVDEDALIRLKKSCRQHAPDCTQEEIIHFIHQKGSLVRGRDTRIHSPIGFLLTAVPKCFSGEAFLIYRQQEQKRRDDEILIETKRELELDEWRKEQEWRLADPAVAEEDKEFIRRCLGV
jgi:hypothetical protein